MAMHLVRFVLHIDSIYGVEQSPRSGREEPMATQPIEHKVYSYTYKKPRRPQEDVDFPLGPEQSKKRQDDAPQTGSGVRGHIRALLANVPRRDDGRLSFKDVADYRDAVEAGWDRSVNAALTGLGVDVSRPFRLMTDPSTGAVTAGSDHPDKGRIDNYFASNQDKAEEFTRIIQLGKLVDTSDKRLTPDEMEQTLPLDAMAWWYQTNMDNGALFKGGGVVFGAGGSAYKSLDIRV